MKKYLLLLCILCIMPILMGAARQSVVVPDPSVPLEGQYPLWDATTGAYLPEYLSIPRHANCTTFLEGETSTATEAKACIQTSNNVLYYLDELGVVHSTVCVSIPDFKIDGATISETPLSTDIICGTDLTCTPGGTQDDPSVTIDVTPGADSIVRMASDVSTTVDTFSDATGLSFAVEANTEYHIEARIIYTTAATTTGINLAASGPASPTIFVGNSFATPATLTSGVARGFQAYNTSTAYTDALSGNNYAHMTFMLLNGLNPGTFVIRFASEVDTSQVTIKAGSILKYRATN
jgi:hypothetical protein